MENLAFVLKELEQKWDVVSFVDTGSRRTTEDHGYSFILLMFNHKLGKLR